jgi:hypothetical protein
VPSWRLWDGRGGYIPDQIDEGINLGIAYGFAPGVILAGTFLISELVNG